MLQATGNLHPSASRQVEAVETTDGPSEQLGSTGPWTELCLRLGNPFGAMFRALSEAPFKLPMGVPEPRGAWAEAAFT